MGRVKALLPWPATQQPFVLHVTETLRDAATEPVAVVTGAHHDTLAPVLDAAGVAALFNPHHEQGQLSSLVHGLDWAFAHTSGMWAMVTLVDVPGVTVGTVRALLGAAPDPTIRAVRPVVAGRHGHPVLWHRHTLPLLHAADAARGGGRAVMHALVAAGQVLDVPVADTGVLLDVDTPEEYQQLSVG